MTKPAYRDILRLTWKQYILHFDVVLWANLLIALPVHAIVTVVLPLQLGPTGDVSSLTWLNAILVDPNFWFEVVLNFLGNLLLVYIEVMLVLLLRRMYQQQRAPWPYLWKEAATYYPRAVAISIITTVATMVGLGLLVLPGIVISVLLSLALPVLVWENVSVGQALRHSIQLVRGHWWQIGVLLLLTQLWLSVMVWLLLGSLPTQAAFTIFGLTVSSIMGSFLTILQVILYTTGMVVWQEEPPKSWPDS